MLVSHIIIFPVAFMKTALAILTLCIMYHSLRCDSRMILGTPDCIEEGAILMLSRPYSSFHTLVTLTPSWNPLTVQTPHPLPLCQAMSGTVFGLKKFSLIHILLIPFGHVGFLPDDQRAYF